MKWIGAFLTGLLAGGAAALVVLYFNPLSNREVADVESSTLLSYELGQDTLSFTHGDQLGLDRQPDDIPLLWEASIRRSMLGMFVLEEHQGGVAGIASRSLKLSSDSNLLTRGIVADDHWLVTVPGAGSYFIESNVNLWPLVRDTVIDVNLLGRDWPGPKIYELSRGPNRDGSAAVTGISGQFAGIVGTASHSLELGGYEDLSQLRFSASGQLRLGLRNPTAQVVTTP